MTFIDLASLGCGKYEVFSPKTQFWPTVRRVGVSINCFKKRNNNRNSDVCPETVTILLTFSNIVTKIVVNYKAEFIIEI